MSKEDYGLLPLLEDDEHWAKGHVGDAEATEILRDYLMDYEGEEDPGRCVAVRKTYARWVPRSDGLPGMPEAKMELVLWQEKGPGAFPVTLVAPWKEVRRERAVKAMREAREALLRLEVATLYPGATAVSISRAGDGVLMIRLRAPDLISTLNIRSDLPWQATATREDHPVASKMVAAAKERVGLLPAVTVGRWR